MVIKSHVHSKGKKIYIVKNQLTCSVTFSSLFLCFICLIDHKKYFPFPITHCCWRVSPDEISPSAACHSPALAPSNIFFLWQGSPWEEGHVPFRGEFLMRGYFHCWSLLATVRGKPFMDRTMCEKPGSSSSVATFETLHKLQLGQLTRSLSKT